jgi:hypothetical protein
MMGRRPPGPVVDEIRDQFNPLDPAVIVPMVLGVGGILSGVFVWQEYRGAAFLAVIGAAFVSGLIRSRVLVTEDEVIIVRALWRRRLPRSRVASVSRTGAYPSRIHLEGDRGWGVMLPFSGVELTERLAAVLGVPVDHREA